MVVFLSCFMMGKEKQKTPTKNFQSGVIVKIDSVSIEWNFPFLYHNQSPVHAVYRVYYGGSRPIILELEGTLTARFMVDLNQDAISDTVFRAPYRFQKKGDFYHFLLPKLYAAHSGRFSLQKTFSSV